MYIIMYFIGQAKDIHKLKLAKSKVTLGGFSFMSDYQAVAVSDGDLVLHAIANAILGASQSGDIGMYFPDSNPVNRGLDSKKILTKAITIANKKGYSFVNCDLTIICDKIMIDPIRNNICNSLYKLLKSKHVNVKATRFEEDKSLIMVESVVLLKKGK